MELYRRLRLDDSGIGATFGRLTVIGPWFSIRFTAAKMKVCVCCCRCGTCIVARKLSLMSKETRSCGCLRRQTTSQTKRTHGKSQSPEYKSWSHMIARCENHKNKKFPLYGGRGISVCQRWRTSFEEFFADMGPRPSPKHSIDRINNDGNYEPGNCRWATANVQSRNNRRTRMLEFRGEHRCVSDWAEHLGLPAYVLRQRLRDGWSIERALTTGVKR